MNNHKTNLEGGKRGYGDKQGHKSGILAGPDAPTRAENRAADPARVIEFRRSGDLDLR